jgi:hypothetical protein
MNELAGRIQRVYLTLLLGSTLAASFIWGINTLFLLDAGLSNLELLWQMSAPFWPWAVVSILLGFGFTFFSGAVEAWLVDALRFAGYDGSLETVMGRGQMVTGAAMLGGSVLGGVIPR